jgi:hypothetical protein
VSGGELTGIVTDIAALEAGAARERRHVCVRRGEGRESVCKSERSAATVSVRFTAHRVDDSSGASPPRPGMSPGVLRPA